MRTEALASARGMRFSSSLRPMLPGRTGISILHRPKENGINPPGRNMAAEPPSLSPPAIYSRIGAAFCLRITSRAQRARKKGKKEIGDGGGYNVAQIGRLVWSCMEASGAAFVLSGTPRWR